jgi:exodeoxyribonuclease VII large subunit
VSQPPVISVSQLTGVLKDLVEQAFPCVWVVGEISNLSRAGSGHLYFTLKDDEAQIRAVMWRSAAARLKFQVHDGLEVVAAGPVEVYGARGTYQLVAQQMVPQGLGALELAFRQLHEKLAAEGLFAPERKRPLPRFPRRIALVTSPSGAAVRDMLQVTMRRWSGTDVIVVPTPVQGAGAAQEIAAALAAAALIPGVEVIIVGRGGGSLEDLWAFNEEVVARAIHASPIPVVSGVGHEIDVCIADLVADRRALTPSEAAELVVPQRTEVAAELGQIQRRMTAALRGQALRARARVESLAARRVFSHPYERLHDLARRLDESEARLQRALRRRLEAGRRDIAMLAQTMEALSPLKVLARGYSITRLPATNHVVRDARSVMAGDTLETLVPAGRIISQVERVELD